MPLRKKKTNSEATVTMTVTLTSIIPTDKEFEKAQTQAENEAKRIEKALKKLSGVDNVDVQRTKTFLRTED
jgi:DNA-binding transcriptional regulator GbsR (MarR family)